MGNAPTRTAAATSRGAGRSAYDYPHFDAGDEAYRTGPGGADPTFPWLPIIEVVADTLPSGVVRTYSIDDVRRIVLGASRCPLVVPDLVVVPARRATVPPSPPSPPSPRVARFSAQGAPWSKAGSSLAAPRLPGLLPFAGALLTADPRLSRLRFRAVPSRMSEAAFWTLYCDRILVLLWQQLADRETSSTTAGGARHRTVDLRWERLLCIRGRLARDVAYACACCPAPVRAVGGSSGSRGASAGVGAGPPTPCPLPSCPVKPRRHHLVSTQYDGGAARWSRALVDACLEWVSQLDGDPARRKSMEEWFGARRRELEVRGASPAEHHLALCHLYAMAHCPALQPQRSDDAGEGGGGGGGGGRCVTPLMGAEWCTLSATSSLLGIVLAAPGTTVATPPAPAAVDGAAGARSIGDTTTTAATTTTTPPWALTRAAKVVPPDPHELRTVSRLVREQRSLELLFLAISHGRVGSVQEILLGGTLDVTAPATTRRAADGATPLHAAVLACRLDCVRALLAAGAPAAATMMMPSAAAAAGEAISCYKAALGVPALEQTFEMWFVQALVGGRAGRVQDMLEAGRPAAAPLLTGEVPLFWAVQQGAMTGNETAIVDLLLDRMVAEGGPGCLESLRDASGRRLVEVDPAAPAVRDLLARKHGAVKPTGAAAGTEAAAAAGVYVREVRAVAALVVPEAPGVAGFVQRSCAEYSESMGAVATVDLLSVESVPGVAAAAVATAATAALDTQSGQLCVGAARQPWMPTVAQATSLAQGWSFFPLELPSLLSDDDDDDDDDGPIEIVISRTMSADSDGLGGSAPGGAGRGGAPAAAAAGRKGGDGGGRGGERSQWCGWWAHAGRAAEGDDGGGGIPSPAAFAALGARLIKEGLAGPLFLVVYVGGPGGTSLAELFSPFRYTEVESGVPRTARSRAAVMKGTVACPGVLCFREELGARLEAWARKQDQAVADGAGDGAGGGAAAAAAAAALVVEMRFDKSFGAWIEASRGLVLRGDGTVVGDGNDDVGPRVGEPE